ncbi:putative toxin-antitoxin system toxin component, PIN family [Desulfomicrobium salsuginis]
MIIVIDTNVLVAGLLSPFGPCGDIVRLASAGKLRLALDARILSEYREVLLRPKFRFNPDKIASLLDQLGHRGLYVAPSPLSASLPDPDDEAFLEVALAADAACLITGNLAHFPAKVCAEMPVLSPGDFLHAFRLDLSRL